MIECTPRLNRNSTRPHGRKLVLLLNATVLAAFLLANGSSAQAQLLAPRTKTVIIPPSSHSSATEAGLTAHTNLRYVETVFASPSELPPYSGYGYETPASLACLYKVVKPIPGCNPNQTTNTPSGGSQTIAIVDAYNDPNAASDLAVFSAQFGLATPKFHVVYAGGSKPPIDPTGGWEIEESLDIEYAHAMAPNATLYLVEANSNYDYDLFGAIVVANNLVMCGQTTTCPAHSKGRGEVSMSWGGEEFPEETSLDAYFTAPGVTYFAAAGDAPGVIYPCASPNVVCAGGTSTTRSEYTGNFIAEITWQDGGGGVSFYEPIPSYQAGIHSIARQTQGYRGVPDLSADSNPNTGVWVLDTFPSPGPGWYIVGGTSAATPTLAGIVNSSGDLASSSVAELSKLYSFTGFGGFGNFNDITYGACGFYSGTFASHGWDQCTGLGSPMNLGDK